MKSLKLVVVLSTLLAANAFAYQTGVGSSVEVSTLKGTVTQEGQAYSNQQGIEASVSKDGTSVTKQIGTYDNGSSSTSTMKGNLVDTTTTTQAYTFFDH